MLTPLVREFKSSLTPWQVFQTAYGRAEVAFFLDSIRYKLPDQRYSYIGLAPVAEMRLEPSDVLPPVWTELRGWKIPRVRTSRLFETLREMLAEYRCAGKRQHEFFTGGAVGLWGYDLLTLSEPVHHRAKPAPQDPLLYLGFFTDLIVYDHKHELYYLVVNSSAGRKKSAVLEARFNHLENCFQDSPARQEDFSIHGFKTDISKAKFERMVRSAKSYIAAGDIYQANLSQRFSFSHQGSALELYGRLREINPSPFASFFKLGDRQMISSSPERLVSKTGRLCETRPIAGTRPRKMKGLSNRQVREELLGNEKERAEHIMLVDLERNDLGRVCEWPSVKVEELMQIEEYSHVIHIVSKITGQLRKDCDGLDLIQAMFPGGTITGCPKIRCMEIIDELEPERRGLYTGSVGYLDFYGDLDLNIIIRTILLQGSTGTLQVGAGIVHDSDPAHEFQETLHKGEALAEALFQVEARA